MKIRSLLLVLLMITCVTAFAQETLVDLTYNAVLAKRAMQKKPAAAASKMSVAPGDTLALPFLEDFSGVDVYPDPAKWLDSNVFINSTFPKAPPTLGVATFDGLKWNGLAYNIDANSGSTAGADTLTSKPVNMSGITDSVYFSFFYQAQGRGNAPEGQDSLVLEFRAADSTWHHIWSKPGYQLSSNDSTFNFVNLYVPTQYYYGGFQFRFRNYATLSGNVDHWHLDYIYINRPRTFNETASSFYDATFVYPAPRLLKNYYAMPYRQYTTAEFDSTYWNPIRNNNPVDINVTDTIIVRNGNGVMVNPPNTETGNIQAYATSGYTTCPTPGCPNLLNKTIHNYVFPVMTDSMQYTVTEKIKTPALDLIHSNDSTSRTVNFYNYYAYDDGSAEQAYGVYGAFSLLAYKFALTTPDTLRAVSIFWNPFVTNAEPHGIRITVWGDQSGQPGQILYQDSVEQPQYHTGYNDFEYYMLDDTILRLNSGTFYIGFMQIDPETLSVGMDMNSNVQSKIFYNTAGNWQNTTYKGALMMRPHFGENFTPMGVHDPGPKAAVTYLVYPNPANDKVCIRRTGDDKEPARVSVYDAYGREVLPSQMMSADHTMDVSSLAAGLYFIRIESAGTVSAHRLVITR